MHRVTVVRLYPPRLPNGTLPPGLSCDEEGVSLCGITSLVLREENADGKASYCERSITEINFALSEAYGTQIDFSGRLPLLRKIAEHLTCRNLSAARVAAVHLRIPEIHDQAALTRLNKAEAALTADLRQIAKLPAVQPKCTCSPEWADRVRTQKRDVSDEPRIPKGQSGGGRWTADAGGSASNSMIVPAQITIPFPGSGTIIAPRPIPILPPMPITPTLPYDPLTPTNPYPKDEGCVEEWEYAIKKCNELLNEGKLKPGRGGYGADYNKCLLGLVSERCGGNPVA